MQNIYTFLFHLLLTASFVCVLPDIVISQTKTNIQVKRVTAMKDIAQSMRRLRSAQKVEDSRAPAKLILNNTRKLANLWPRNSGGITTRARDTIWKNYEDFNSKLRGMLLAADSLTKSTLKKDFALVRSQFINLGKTCKACHKLYRKPKL